MAGSKPDYIARFLRKKDHKIPYDHPWKKELTKDMVSGNKRQKAEARRYV